MPEEPRTPTRPASPPVTEGSGLQTSAASAESGSDDERILAALKVLMPPHGAFSLADLRDSVFAAPSVMVHTVCALFHCQPGDTIAPKQLSKLERYGLSADVLRDATPATLSAALRAEQKGMTTFVGDLVRSVVPGAKTAPPTALADAIVALMKRTKLLPALEQLAEHRRPQVAAAPAAPADGVRRTSSQLDDALALAEWEGVRAAGTVPWPETVGVVAVTEDRLLSLFDEASTAADRALAAEVQSAELAGEAACIVAQLGELQSEARLALDQAGRNERQRESQAEQRELAWLEEGEGSARELLQQQADAAGRELAQQRGSQLAASLNAALTDAARCACVDEEVWRRKGLEEDADTGRQLMWQLGASALAGMHAAAHAGRRVCVETEEWQRREMEQAAEAELQLQLSFSADAAAVAAATQIVRAERDEVGGRARTEDDERLGRADAMQLSHSALRALSDASAQRTGREAAAAQQRAEEAEQRLQRLEAEAVSLRRELQDTQRQSADQRDAAAREAATTSERHRAAAEERDAAAAERDELRSVVQRSAEEATSRERRLEELTGELKRLAAVEEAATEHTADREAARARERQLRDEMTEAEQAAGRRVEALEDALRKEARETEQKAQQRLREAEERAAREAERADHAEKSALERIREAEQRAEGLAEGRVREAEESARERADRSAREVEERLKETEKAHAARAADLERQLSAATALAAKVPALKRQLEDEREERQEALAAAIVSDSLLTAAEADATRDAEQAESLQREALAANLVHEVMFEASAHVALEESTQMRAAQSRGEEAARRAAMESVAEGVVHDAILSAAVSCGDAELELQEERAKRALAELCDLRARLDDATSAVELHRSEAEQRALRDTEVLSLREQLERTEAKLAQTQSSLKATGELAAMADKHLSAARSADVEALEAQRAHMDHLAELREAKRRHHEQMRRADELAGSLEAARSRAEQTEAELRLKVEHGDRAVSELSAELAAVREQLKTSREVAGRRKAEMEAAVGGLERREGQVQHRTARLRYCLAGALKGVTGLKEPLAAARQMLSDIAAQSAHYADELGSGIRSIQDYNDRTGAVCLHTAVEEAKGRAASEADERAEFSRLLRRVAYVRSVSELCSGETVARAELELVCDSDVRPSVDEHLRLHFAARRSAPAATARLPGTRLPPLSRRPSELTVPGARVVVCGAPAELQMLEGAEAAVREVVPGGALLDGLPAAFRDSVVPLTALTVAGAPHVVQRGATQKPRDSSNPRARRLALQEEAVRSTLAGAAARTLSVLLALKEQSRDAVVAKAELRRAEMLDRCGVEHDWQYEDDLMHMHERSHRPGRVSDAPVSAVRTKRLRRELAASGAAAGAGAAAARLAAP